MNTYRIHVDLDLEADPVRRAACHGLWRFLHHGEKDDRFPVVRQTDTCKWTLTDTTLDLEGTVEDFNNLLAYQLGDFRDGIAINPGYEANPNDPAIYATILFHRGTTSTEYFRGPSGSCRSKGLGRAQDKDLKVAWIAKWGHPMIEKVSCLRRADATPVEMQVTPHMRSENTLKLIEGEIGKGKNKTVGLTDPAKYTTAVSCAVATWNNVSIKADPLDVFLLSFSCLSYIYTGAVDDLVGLAVDAPTFSAADTIHRRWQGKYEDSLGLLWVRTSDRAALWVLAAVLRLRGVFPALTSKGPLLFDTSLPGDRTTLLFDLLRAQAKAGVLEANSKFSVIDHIPVRTKADGSVLLSTTDLIVFNLENSFRWFRDLGGIYSCKRAFKSQGQEYVGITKKESRYVQPLIDQEIDMTPTEIALMKSFGVLFRGVAKTLAGPDGRPNYDRADSFVFAQNMARATNTRGLRDAIDKIVHKSAYKPDWTLEEVVLMWEMAAKRPADLRALVTFGCKARFEKDAPATPDTNTTPNN